MPQVYESVTGMYTGNGTEVSVETIGFSPSFLLITNESDGDLLAIKLGGTDDGTHMSIGALAARVTIEGVTLSSRGFSAGNHPSANESGKTFAYLALR